jgi:hypothetical protein
MAAGLSFVLFGHRNYLRRILTHIAVTQPQDRQH